MEGIFFLSFFFLMHDHTSSSADFVCKVVNDFANFIVNADDPKCVCAYVCVCVCVYTCIHVCIVCMYVYMYTKLLCHVYILFIYVYMYTIHACVCLSVHLSLGNYSRQTCLRHNTSHVKHIALDLHSRSHRSKSWKLQMFDYFRNYMNDTHQVSCEDSLTKVL